MNAFVNPVGCLALLLALSPLGSLAAEADGAVVAAAQQSDDKDRTYFTDLELVTQDGETVRFYTDVLKDQVVLISFIFTNCGNACPMQTRSLVDVSELLGEEARKSVRFISISIDPERDTPAAMKAFAIKHGADQPGWLFLTGEPAKVNQVVKKLGQYTPDVEAHSTLLLAGNLRERHWIKVQPNLAPQGIAERLRELLGTGISSAGG